MTARRLSPSPAPLSIVILGLSITSSWGNGHATTYRALVRALQWRGHRIAFLERDLPWYADNRDLPKPPYGETFLYRSLTELKRRFRERVRAADLVIVGSFVPEGIAVGEWVTREARGITAFYDIDTPVTLNKLRRCDADYLTPTLVSRYDLYLSFTGGPILTYIERHYRARAARPLYCSVDPELYAPTAEQPRWDLGYMGTYSADRQAKLDALLCEPARLWPTSRFAVVGPQYPSDIAWPRNVKRVQHLAPDRHRSFYARQRFTLNLTRADMVRWGWSPSVRLFEAAACATPVISDPWPGLDSFFTPGREILLARNAAECLAVLRELPEDERRRIATAARARVLSNHTAARRAAELEGYWCEAAGVRQMAGDAPSAGTRMPSRDHATLTRGRRPARYLEECDEADAMPPAASSAGCPPPVKSR